MNIPDVYNDSNAKSLAIWDIQNKSGNEKKLGLTLKLNSGKTIWDTLPTVSSKQGFNFLDIDVCLLGISNNDTGKVWYWDTDNVTIGVSYPIQTTFHTNDFGKNLWLTTFPAIYGTSTLHSGGPICTSSQSTVLQKTQS